MGDTGSLKRVVRRSKVNRIIGLFEIPRPNKNRGLQRTNSLPASSRHSGSLTGEDEDKNTQHTRSFGGVYGNNERVKNIKDKIEQQSREKDDNKITSISQKKSKSRRHKYVSAGNMEEALENVKEAIMDNQINTEKPAGKIEIVTEDLKQSDTELEITFDQVESVNDDVVKNDNEDAIETESDNGELVTVNEDGETVTLNEDGETVSQDDNYDTVDCCDPDNSGDKVGYGKYDLESGRVVFSGSTNSDSELAEISSENDSEPENDNFSHPKDHEEHKQSNAPLETKCLLESENQHSEISDEFNKEEEEEEDINKEKETQRDNQVSEMDSLDWWKHKSFVQINSGNKNPNKDEETATEYSESSTSTLESGRRFIKNQPARQSQRSTRRRTGVMLKSQTVKELAQHFESFKDAAEKGETECYRKSFIDEMDKEIENMKKDGFQEDFHLSFENLSILDYQEDEDICLEDDSKNLYNSDEEINNLDEEPIPLFQTIMYLKETEDQEDLYSSTDEDPFGETLFSEDLEHGLYYVESYNADGKELIVCSVQVDRQSVDLNKLNEVKTNNRSNLLVKQDDEKTLVVMGEAAASHSEVSLNDFNNGTDSKRNTIYSTTSGDSYDDRVTDDEGIYTENSSCSYGYSSARRETFCDDHGVVRIERIAAYPENVEEHPEYINTNNYYYEPEDNNKQEEGEENYYEIIRSEHELTVSVPEVKKETLQYIMEEIKATERKYVYDMEKVLNHYRPFLEERCPDKIPLVFGNMEDIHRHQIEFLETLDNCEDDIKEVVQAFIDFEDLFRLYPRYFRNTPKANAAVKELSFLIKEKQELLNDKLHLSAYLLTPVQRLGKYKLFLENIIKQLKKEEKSSGAAEMALEIIKKYMTRGNDAVAVASILHSPLHFRDYGSFVTREKFLLLKPKRMELMVFLFEEVVVFTMEDQRNMEQFIYWQSINTEDLRIATFEDTTIHLTDYTKTKRRYSTTKHTFVLDAKTQKVKNAWKQEIEEILWKQLKKVKEDDYAFSQNFIQDCPFDIDEYGSFLLNDEFIVRKPKKMAIIVFLYEKIIILTKKQANEDSVYHIGSIKMNQLSLLPPNKKYKYLLEIKDHLNSSKFHKDIIFKLEASSESTQVEWRLAIEKCLWRQLLKAKCSSQA